MGLSSSTLPIRPWYPPEKELTQAEHQVLLVLRLASLGWAGSSYLRALLISPLRYSGRPLFLETLQEPAQRAVRTYTFFAWYLSLRFYLASTNRGSLLKRLARRIARRARIWQVLLGAVLAHTVLDELVYTLCVLFNDNKAQLAGRPLPPTTMATASPVCCICHDGDRLASLANYCRESRDHAAHDGCMQAWYTSTNALSHCCPLCRGSLRTDPTPLPERCAVLFRSRNFWSGLWRRLGAALGCTSAAAGIFWVGLVLRALRSRLRPGYTHGKALSTAVSGGR
eukprot:TRINITY_DN9245_c0_g1_i1.p1 TRINITY_DN9245_c0_g1~~TRINITY_DN9245_c0_g1_i1.p1  ORF type:complete len:283 (+),score=0.70 TRINITY_DN9245_c0_g1_i1:66-914(+)